MECPPDCKTLHIHKVVLLTVVIGAVILLAEFFSNAALTALMLPCVAELAGVWWLTKNMPSLMIVLTGALFLTSLSKDIFDLCAKWLRRKNDLFYARIAVPC